MYEDMQFCEVCGRRIVRRKTGSVRYSRRTGEIESVEWVLLCPAANRFLGLFQEFTRHPRIHWWEDIDAR